MTLIIYKSVIKRLLYFKFTRKLIRLEEQADKRFMNRNYLLVVFTFNKKLWIKWAWTKFQQTQVVFYEQRLFLLKAIFSTHLIVGLSMLFKEYLGKYLKAFKYLIFAKCWKFAFKHYFLLCLNANFFKCELIYINYMLFLFFELYKLNLNLTKFKSSFFSYSIWLWNYRRKKKKTYILHIIKNEDFKIKISFKHFFYFFRYLEHLRSIKYNEYLILHIGLGKYPENLALRKNYIYVYYNWFTHFMTLEERFVIAFRKGLLYKFYILYYGRYLREKQMEYSFSKAEIFTIFFDVGFVFLNLLKREKNFNKLLFFLNRQSIRHTLRFLAYIQIMRKDRKWKWFHWNIFETIKDFIFYAFKKGPIMPIYNLIIPYTEKKLLNWQLKQSSFCFNYFILDLKMFGTRIESFWENYYWKTLFVDSIFFRCLMTNIFTNFIIRIVNQLNFGAYNDPFDDAYVFYHKYRGELYQRLLLYSFLIDTVFSEFYFEVDYFLWRIWYNSVLFYQTSKSYYSTTVYDKILLYRYLGIVDLFTKMRASTTLVNLRLFSLYALLRDLFYKNLKNEFIFLTLLFFLKIPILNSSLKNNIYNYDFRSHINKEFFLSIAPISERDINLFYITDPAVKEWYALPPPRPSSLSIWKKRLLEEKKIARLITKSQHSKKMRRRKSK